MSTSSPGDDGTTSLSKFTLFETKSRFYITASTGSVHRILKIDRTDPTSLNVVEDTTTYDAKELDQLLRMVQDGNKSQGGLEKVLEFHGIVGFVRFTAGWYLILITKRSVVGLLGGHYIYHCDETTLLTIASKTERTAQETKLLNIFQQVDLTKNFYFSYSYDITNTLQINLTVSAAQRKWNTRFMWNYHLAIPAFNLEETQDRCRWVLPLIHGFVDQAKINVFTRTVYLTLLARRSRFFAGTRFLTRGANDNGHVANEVETEQIVSEPLATPFGAKSPYTNGSVAGYGGYTSFVQYRGSIPVMWHQESTQLTARPPIEITIKDPFYTPAAKHFDDLLGRYGAPIFILNLIKAREKEPRESKLLFEYGQCVAYLNQFLPEDKKMRYIAWDMAQAAKSGHQDVIGVLEDICEESLQATNFFHGGPSRSENGSGSRRDQVLLQHGILRVNCVDCLDRTNAAQFAIAKRAFGHQLHALGLLGSPNLPFNCDAVDVLTEMYHDHGDTLAWQYTGSALVNRVDTYRRTKAGQWSSHSRDLLENIRRFYNNSMLDADKQAAINLFLGVESAAPVKTSRPHYRQWYNTAHLDPPKTDKLAPVNQVFKEYYKPHILSQFGRLYAFTMNSTTRFTVKPKNEILHSPFESRIPLELASPTRERPPPLRRSARRWAHRAEEGDPTEEAAQTAETGPTKRETHPVDELVASLLDPPDIEQRIQEYDWYTHYPVDDLTSHTLGEEKDLQLYIRAARIADGDGVDQMLTNIETNPAPVPIITNLDSEDVVKANTQFYENWLKA
ncbi:SacI homology domain-domain-containing protein [Kockovaella imperatae]|uniref:SacI homology domain-domain-containing protein n=1 Tax=Kockovaella imperatae TaxID=4999 RepID=A0A1Y1UIL7_9TREE|nr:SacI homology domain-domain-containing protein [Kockovaella imperatae]ORX37871.1 SacI homology domain-domain-containing protein [Kockovaella imperatae]